MENGNNVFKKVQTSSNLYGCIGFYPNCLQKINSINFVVLFICVSHCSQGALNGLFGVSLSTLEKRFDFSSSQSSWIASAYEIGQIPAIIFISTFGNSLHRPKCIAFGMILVSFGGIIFFIPHFTSPLYYLSLSGSLNTTFEKQLCEQIIVQSNITSNCDSNSDSNSVLYLGMLIIARLLIGVGATPTLSLAVTYINDMCTKEKFATYAGIYNSMGIVGPAVGIIFGGFMLSLFVDFYFVDPNEIGLNKSHPNWLGNWWMPYIILSFVALLAAIPMFGYPNDLPGAAEIRHLKIEETKEDSIIKTNLNKKSSLKESLRTYTSLIKNFPFIFLVLFNSCELFIIVGFNSFGAKLFELTFLMPNTISGLVFGLTLLPAGAFGTIIGGTLITKFKLTCKQLLKTEVCLSLFVLTSLLLIFLRCQPLKVAGIEVPYENIISNFSLQQCNINCNCKNLPYEPVCSVDHILFQTPCIAGCTSETINAKHQSFFNNCGCVNLKNESSMDAEFAHQVSASFCETSICLIAYIFLPLFFLSVGALFATVTFTMSANLRCVTSKQATLAVGLSLLCSKIFGSIPGPILFGLAFDASCDLWSQNSDGCEGSETKGACYHYDTWLIVRNLFIICFTVKFIATVFIIFATLMYHPPKAKVSEKNEGEDVITAFVDLNKVADRESII